MRLFRQRALWISKRETEWQHFPNLSTGSFVHKSILKDVSQANPELEVSSLARAIPWWLFLLSSFSYTSQSDEPIRYLPLVYAWEWRNHSYTVPLHQPPSGCALPVTISTSPGISVGCLISKHQFHTVTCWESGARCAETSFHKQGVSGHMIWALSHG